MMKKILIKTMVIFLIIIFFMNCGLIHIIPSFALTDEEKNKLIEQLENKIKEDGTNVGKIVETNKITNWKVGDDFKSKIYDANWGVKINNSQYKLSDFTYMSLSEYEKLQSKSPLEMLAWYTINQNKKFITITNSEGKEEYSIKDGINIFSFIFLYDLKSEEGAAAAVSVVDIEKKVTNVNIVGNTSVYVGENINLDAEISPSDASNKTITWTTSDKAKATVDSTGKVTGVSAGTVTITATANNGIKDTHKVTIKEKSIAVEKVNITGATNMIVGENTNLVASITPSNATVKTITWTTSDKTKATVDSTGKVTGISAGTVTITATANNGIKATHHITIKEESNEKDVEEVKIQGENKVSINSSVQLIVKILPDDATDKKIIWSSSDEKIAIVDENGKVTGKSIGEVEIIATASNGIKAVHKVEITEDTNDIEIKTLKIKGENCVKYNEEIELQVETEPSDIKNVVINWKSSDEKIAIVDENGKVKGISEGTVIITATTSNGIVATHGINVYENEKNDKIDVQNIIINTVKNEIKIGDKIKLETKITPENATNKNLIWISGNPEIAEVDGNGNITGKKAGKTIIIALTNNMKIASYEIKVLEENKISAESIKINGEKNIIEIDEEIELSASIEPENVTNKNVIWISTSDEIIEINKKENNLIVKGKKAGNATIIAVTENLKIAAYSIEVKDKVQEVINVEEIKIESEKNKIKVNEKIKLEAIITPENATNKDIIWISGDENILEVDKDGYVTGKKSGKTIIIAMTSNMKMARYEMIVEEEQEEITEVKSIKINGEKNKIKVNEKIKLEAIITPENATDKQIEWKSSNSEIAEVDENGNVTGLKKGEVIISAITKNNIKDEFIIEIIEEVKEKNNVVDIYSKIYNSEIKVGEKTFIDIGINVKELKSNISAIYMKIEYPNNYVDVTISEENNMKILSTEEIEKIKGEKFEEGTIGIIPSESIKENNDKIIMQLELKGIKENENATIKIKNIILECENDEKIVLDNIEEKIIIKKIEEQKKPNLTEDDNKKENNDKNNNNNNDKKDNTNNKNQTKDENLYKGNLAYAGKNIMTFTGLIFMAISSFVLYRKYKLI